MTGSVVGCRQHGVLNGRVSTAAILKRALGLLALALLFPTGPTYAQNQVMVSPALLYNDPYRSPTPPIEPTLAQAWADEQAFVDICNSGTCYTALNLHPWTTGAYGYTVNGVWYQQSYDRQACAGSTCNTASDWGTIITQTSCPVAGGSGSGNWFPYPTVQVRWCPLNLPTVIASPKTCQSCIGNPIQVSAGEKLQAETDYSALPALAFTRTYRSGIHSFSSTLSTQFIDYSQAAGTLTGGCYPSYYPNASAQIPYCFQYISNAVQSYQVRTDDGRYIQFSGPNTAVTQNADVNDRVVHLAGSNQWQVTRDDDSQEIYNSTGSLLQKTLRGGLVITYTYSTTSTPPSIAPRPGLLLTESDPFGHTLSWQYNSLSQAVQMTDPAGGVYSYGYDSIGNLTSVTYPDSSSKTYIYNESAYTGGTNLPNTMTGITDESGTRYATFTYNASGFAVGTQHAGGVDNYALSGFYAGYGATVTDPLGTSRTYHSSVILSYAQDTSVQQPAASGTGTVTKTWAHDSHGNISQITDFNGNINQYTYDLTRNLETSRTEAYSTTSARTITTTWSASFRLPDLRLDFVAT